MKNLNDTEQIQTWIRSAMEQTGIERELRLKDNGRNMIYDFIHDYVGVDPVRAQQAAAEMNLPLPLETYIKILTIHELGHAMDRPALMESLSRTIEIFDMKAAYSLKQQMESPHLQAMRLEEQEMNLEFEKTAWANAARLNEGFKIADWDSFERVKNHSLESYLVSYERELQAAMQLKEEAALPA